MKNDQSTAVRALRAAFPYTIPIFAGYWFLGLTYGIYMNASGFSFWYPLLIALMVYGGSLEFVIVSLLQAPFAPLQAFIMAVLIQARHLFYGLAMLEKYKGMGWKKPLLIYWLTDETFAVLCSLDVPEGVDCGWFCLFVSVLNYLYWVSGAVTGGVLGSFISLDLHGLDFCMTAMFVIIFVEQWLKEKSKITPLVGLAASAACLWVFGPQNFMIPAMLVILAVLIIGRGPIAKAGDYE